MSRFLWMAGLCMAASVAPPRADAMQMELTRSQLCGISDAVVVGSVSDIEALWAATEDGGIERRAFLNGLKVVRGPQQPAWEVVLPGGQIGGYWHWVEDVPELQVDHTYMLFLARTTRGWEVIGGEEGAVRVAPNGFGTGITIAEAIASLEGCHAR